MKYLLVIVPLLLGGCCVHTAGIKAANEAWIVLHQEYYSYVSQDSSLPPEQKDTKKRTADLFTKLLKELAKS
jgi:hypothetical protein